MADIHSSQNFPTSWFFFRTKTHRDFSLAGPPRTRRFRSARFKDSFSDMKLVSEVNSSKSSNICLICSRSSLKRLKDINKNAISTPWIIAKVSQKLYYDFKLTDFTRHLTVCRYFKGKTWWNLGSANKFIHMAL